MKLPSCLLSKLIYSVLIKLSLCTCTIDINICIVTVSFGVATHFEPDAGLSEEVVLWHRAVLEDDVAGGGRADAELVLLLAEGESWGAIQ